MHPAAAPHALLWKNISLKLSSKRRLAAIKERIIYAKEVVMIELLSKVQSRFEEHMIERRDGSVFWSARELAQSLEYVHYPNFLKVIRKAIQACAENGRVASDEFAEVVRIPRIKDAVKPVKDFELTEYACLLIVQNADSRKQPVSDAQTYFAVKNYKQESSGKSASAANPQSSNDDPNPAVDQ
jgi:hypothetical protein